MTKQQLIEKAPAELRAALRQYVAEGNYRSVASMVLWGFNWAGTAQGEKFWQRWYDRLMGEQHNATQQ